jgi:hypothetical protein
VDTSPVRLYVECLVTDFLWVLVDGTGECGQWETTGAQSTAGRSHNTQGTLFQRFREVQNGGVSHRVGMRSDPQCSASPLESTSIAVPELRGSSWHSGLRRTRNAIRKGSNGREEEAWFGRYQL